MQYYLKNKNLKTISHTHLETTAVSYMYVKQIHKFTKQITKTI